ncbi:MAG: MFS transporter, partial [Pseudomonadales bacterium]|nr:MFS transporter [Pseudomonadales bacterium]
TQQGLMGGLAFALFYTGLGIPIAMLADSKSRTWIMTIALAVWSAMTAACGLAQNFWQLFAARVGVGMGEAGGVAPAYSLITDYFPPGKRGRALSIFSFGIPIGSALGIVLGGVFTSLIDWRYAFFIVGIAGIALAPLFRLTVREPSRGQFDRATTGPAAVGPAEVARKLKQKKAFWYLSLAGAFTSMTGYGLYFWLPSYFVRTFNLSVLDASFYFGAMLLFGGLAGIWAGGVLADRYSQRTRAAHAVIPAIALLMAVPFFVIGVMSDSLLLTFIALLVPVALGLTWLAPVLSAVQHLVQPNMRATASAVFLFINNLIGLGAGTVVIGAISDALQSIYGDESLRYSILAGTVFYFFAIAFFFLAARSLNRDWED